jgi:hypothetical protein
MPKDLFEKTPEKKAPKDLFQNMPASVTPGPSNPPPKPGPQVAGPPVGIPYNPKGPEWWKTALRQFDNGVRALASGASLGWADELAAAGNAAFNGKTYEENLAAEQKRDQEINPVVDVAGNMLGGVGTGLLAGAPVAGALSKAPAVVRGLSYPVLGVAEGALAGAGYAPPGQRTKGAMIGGTAGAALGTAIPLAGAGIKAGVNRFKQAVGPTEDAALSRVYNAMIRDGMTPEQAMAKVREMGPEAALIDTGKNMSGLAEAIATRPGKALSEATDFLETRQAGQMDRVIKLLDDAVPPARSVISVERTPDFENALKLHIPLSPKLKTYLQRPSIRDAWKRAQTLAAEGDEVLPNLDDVLANGEVVGVETRVMHWLKKGLDDILEPKRNPISGQLESELKQNQLRAVESSRREFREAVKCLNPDYAKQLGRVEAAKKVEEAYKRGGEFLSRSMDPSAIRNILFRFNKEQKEAYQRGAVEAIISKLEPAGEIGFDITGAAIKMRPKLEAAFGKSAVDDIISKIKTEREFRQTGNRVLSNSRTAYRQSAQADFDEGGLGMASDFVTGVPANAVSRGVKMLGDMMRRPAEEIADEVAPILFTKSPEEQARILDQLIRVAAKRSAIDNTARNVTAGAMGGAIQPVSQGLQRK